MSNCSTELQIIIEEDHVLYRRNILRSGKYEFFKEVGFNALFIKNPDPFIRFTSKFPVSKYTREGIDKIELTINLDYVNEYSNVLFTLKNGSVTVKKKANYLHISIHREYLELEKNLLEQIEKVIWKLLQSGLFKIPLSKQVCIVQSGVVTSDETFSYSGTDTISLNDFFSIIINKISISNVEVFYDFEGKSIFNMFNEDEFSKYKTTFYSKDYKYYDSGSKRNSLVCIYDKSEQLKDVKKIACNPNITRLEFRVFKKFNKKMFSSLEIFNTTFSGFISRIDERLAKQLKKLKISFIDFFKKVNVSNSLMSILEKIFGKKIDEVEDSSIAVLIVWGFRSVVFEDFFRVGYLVFSVIKTLKSKLGKLYWTRGP